MAFFLVVFIPNFIILNYAQCSRYLKIYFIITDIYVITCKITNAPFIFFFKIGVS